MAGQELDAGAEGREVLPETPVKAEAAQLLARTFFREKHYTELHASLSTQWDKLQSLSAAMRLMERHGVTLSQEEVDELSALSEAEQINALVGKMPQQSNEQFQTFFLQLQLLVSTATRIRRALEEGNADLVTEALADSDATGISPYVLRMAVVQAGSEVTALKETFAQWNKDADAKMSRLIRGQTDATAAKKKLAALQAEYMHFNSAQSEKAKKVLMNFASGSESALKAGCFKGWQEFIRKEKQEAEIRSEFEERIEAARMKLIDYKAQQLSGARKLLSRKAMNGTVSLQAEVLKLWRDAAAEAKVDAGLADQIKELEARLSSSKGAQAASTKRVMARMGAAQLGQALSMCFQGWVAYHKEYMKNKEWEDSVKESEKRVKEFMKTKSAGAKKVLESMEGMADSGLEKTCLNAWIEFTNEIRQENKLAEQLEQFQAKSSAFHGRNKTAGMSLMERARVHQERMAMQQVMLRWAMDCKVEVMCRGYHGVIEGKRSQLVGVQTMFRKFAGTLEASIQKGGRDDTRFEVKPPAQRKKMVKDQNSVSLPDIGGSKRSPKSGTRTGTSSNTGSALRTPTGGAYPS